MILSLFNVVFLLFVVHAYEEVVSYSNTFNDYYV